MALLTRSRRFVEPVAPANFNLDSDRGYGYLCWDWVRSKNIEGFPQAFQRNGLNRGYHAPLRPGYGWCKDEIPADTVLPPVGSPDRPLMHDPAKAKPEPVRIRYIDREVK